jgi:hypothetical protein
MYLFLLYLNRFRGEPAITKLNKPFTLITNHLKILQHLRVQPSACSLLDRLVSGQILQTF